MGGERLFKRGNIWFCWVPDPNGGTRRASTHCTDKEAARLVARRLERAAANPEHHAQNQATTRSACDGYLASRKLAGRSAGTLHFYGVKLSHLVRLLPSRLASLSHADVVLYCDTRLAETAARETVKKELRALKSVLRHCKRTGTWAGDIDRVMPEFEATYKPRKRWLTPDELDALVAELSKENNAQRSEQATNRAAMILFMVATGARWLEAVRAERDDIARDFVRLRGTKTQAAARSVPITRLSRPLLRRALKLVGAREGILFDRWDSARRDILVGCIQAGIERCSPNDLRRSFSKWLKLAGTSNELIAPAMGHKSTRMVELVYGQLEPDEHRKLLTGSLMGKRQAKTGTKKHLARKAKK